MKLVLIALVAVLAADSPLFAQKTITMMEWNQVGVMPSPNGRLLGVAGPVAGVTNGVFLAGGGANFPGEMPWNGGQKKYYDNLYLFRRNAHDSLLLMDSANLPEPLAYAACVSVEEGVVVAGGENEAGLSNKVFLLTWQPAANDLKITSLPGLPFALTAASIAYADGVVYVAGGDAGREASNAFLSLQLTNQKAGWQVLSSLPASVSHAVMVAQSNAVYLIGGRKKHANTPSDLYSSVYRYDMGRKQWEQKASLPHALSAGTGVAAGTHHIILFGGDQGETFHKTEKLIFEIAAEKDSAQKAALNLRKADVQATHPGFSRDVLAYDTRTNAWKSAGCIPFVTPVTTVAVPWDNRVYIAGGEIRAGVRTPQILSAKIHIK